MSPRFLTASEAVELIPDGATVATDGFTLLGIAEEVFEEVETRFLRHGHPRGLTLVAASGQSANGGGFDHFAHRGLVTRVVGSHWGLQPKMSRFLLDEGAEAICLPQGQISALYRAIAARRVGNLSKVGIGTFVDPQLEGGRMNAAAANVPAYVQDLEIDGTRHLLFRSFPLDVGIIRATSADSQGNLSIEEEAVTLDQLGIAQAVNASGGILIAQVKRRVDAGAIPPRSVAVPGVLVDVVVVTTDAHRYHRQSFGIPFDPGLITAGTSHVAPQANVSEERMEIGRRAVRDLSPGQTINVGTGVPGDVIGLALVERGLSGEISITVESGTIGGVPLGGLDFGSALHPTAIVPHSHQFDFYDGGGLDHTFMGAGQVDRFGNVNVSKLGDRIIGCGGFIDITQNTPRISFCFLVGGNHPKFVEEVGQITFSAATALARGQQVRYISERAVFELVPSGLRLVEVRPGYDLKRDVLSLLPFPVEVAFDLATSTETTEGARVWPIPS